MNRMVFLLLSFSTLINYTWAASFDCLKASNSIEKIICTNAELSETDEKLMQAYRSALSTYPDKQSLVQQQRNWLKYKRNICNQIECVLNAYKNRILELNSLVSTERTDKNMLTINSLKNATYFFPEKTKLIDGKWSKPIAGSSVLEESRGISEIIFGDLDNDGVKDAAVIIWENEGGTATISRVAAVLNSKGYPLHVATSPYFGDRVERKKFFIENSMIIVELTSPRFFPGKKATLKYKLSGDKLIGPKSPFYENN